MTTTADARHALTRLRLVLDQVATACTRPNLEHLLAGEAALQTALAALPAPGTLPREDAAVLRAELDASRLALMRCQQAGQRLQGFLEAGLQAFAPPPEYGPAHAAPQDVARHSVQVRA